jgi:hypothetical protein
MKTETTQHVAGSRKQKVHALFDSHGADQAWTLGKKLQLKETTLRSWFWQFKKLNAEDRANAATELADKKVRRTKVKQQAKPPVQVKPTVPAKSRPKLKVVANG